MSENPGMVVMRHLARLDLSHLLEGRSKCFVDLKVFLEHFDGNKSDYLFEAISVVNVSDPDEPIPETSVPPAVPEDYIIY